MMSHEQKTGTKEWADTNVNCVRGCTHRCRYCYARAFALRFGRIASAKEWGTTYNSENWTEALKKRSPTKGIVMFPSSHDITLEHLRVCLATARRILQAGNRLLVVSKPQLYCINALMADARLLQRTDNLTFRFTITADDDRLLRYWEPGAPLFAERLKCLQQAHYRGFSTSVSIEPMLDSRNIVRLFHTVKPFVTDTIWIGKMNRIRHYVIPGTREKSIREIEEGQKDERILRIYAALKNEPKVRWKDSN